MSENNNSNETGNTKVVAAEVANIHRVHAHRCENCAKSGKQTIWMHGDEKGGDVAAHKCPECGTVEWKKFLVPNANIQNRARAAVQQTTGAFNLETVLGYVAILVGILLAIYLLQWIMETDKTEIPK